MRFFYQFFINSRGSETLTIGGSKAWMVLFVLKY